MEKIKILKRILVAIGDNVSIFTIHSQTVYTLLKTEILQLTEILNLLKNKKMGFADTGASRLRNNRKLLGSKHRMNDAHLKVGKYYKEKS